MVGKPVLLDLFCGGGGAARGYADAGFKVIGVDNVPQPDYPYEFIQSDALDYLRYGGRLFDAIHASPPCQPYSKAVTSRSSQWNDTKGKDEPALIEPLRELLKESAAAYVIENVIGAPLKGPLELCGTMFGLPIARHRLFETSFKIPIWNIPRHGRCSGVARRYAEERGWDYRDMSVTGKGRRAGTSERWSELLGIDWKMSQHQLKEAIPPAYTRWMGAQLLEVI